MKTEIEKLEALIQSNEQGIEKLRKANKKFREFWFVKRRY